MKKNLGEFRSQDRFPRLYLNPKEVEVILSQDLVVEIVGQSLIDVWNVHAVAVVNAIVVVVRA